MTDEWRGWVHWYKAWKAGREREIAMRMQDGWYWVWDSPLKDWTAWEVFRGNVVVGGITFSVETQHRRGWKFFGPIPEPTFMKNGVWAWASGWCEQPVRFDAEAPNLPQGDPEEGASTKELRRRVDALEAKVAGLCDKETARMLQASRSDFVAWAIANKDKIEAANAAATKEYLDQELNGRKP